ASLSFILDTKAPVVTETVGGTTTSPILTGTGDPNAVVHFTLDGSAVTATTTADATGAWSFTPTGTTATLAAGTHTVVASETDAAGNTGSASLAFTVALPAPVVTAGLASDTGASATDNITSNPALTGTADAGAVVHF